MVGTVSIRDMFPSKSSPCLYSHYLLKDEADPLREETSPVFSSDTALSVKRERSDSIPYDTIYSN